MKLKETRKYLNSILSEEHKDNLIYIMLIKAFYGFVFGSLLFWFVF